MQLKLSNPKIDKLKSNFFFMGILAIIIIVLWITQAVYTAFNKYVPDKEMDKLLTPLNPTLDVKTLEEFKTSRIQPSQQFQIKVVTKDGKQTETYTLDPFTNTTQVIQTASPSSVSSN